MKIEFKYYKLSKIKIYFKNTDFFFLINTTTLENDIVTMQKLAKLSLKSYRFYNSLAKQLLKRSIFSNYLPLIKSGMKLIKYDSTKKFDIKVYLKRSILTSVILNNKLYLSKYIKLSNNLTYSENCANLFKTLKVIINQSSKIVVSK